MAAQIEWERVVGTLMVLSFVLGLAVGCAAGVALVSPRTRTALCGGPAVPVPPAEPR